MNKLNIFFKITVKIIIGKIIFLPILNNIFLDFIYNWLSKNNESIFYK